MTGESQKKLDRLLKKAEDLFLRYGYSAVSVDQIAEEAGISKMTIYKHFTSKENLFIQVMINVSEYHNKIIMDKINEKYHSMEKFEALYTYMLQLASQFPPILSKDIMEHSGIFEKIKSYKEKMALGMWRSILEDGIKKGEIRPLDIDFVSSLLLRLPVTFIDTNYYSNEAVLRKFMENLFDFIKYGMMGGMENNQYQIQKGGEESGEEKCAHEGSECKQGL